MMTTTRTVADDLCDVLRVCFEPCTGLVAGQAIALHGISRYNLGFWLPFTGTPVPFLAAAATDQVLISPVTDQGHLGVLIAQWLPKIDFSRGTDWRYVAAADSIRAIGDAIRSFLPPSAFIDAHLKVIALWGLVELIDADAGLALMQDVARQLGAVIPADPRELIPIAGICRNGGMIGGIATRIAYELVDPSRRYTVDQIRDALSTPARSRGKGAA